MENYKLLMHSWGTSPAQKRKEAEYNHKYYEEHKEKWKKIQSAHEKRAANTELLTGKQDTNEYKAATKLHIKRTPKQKMDEDSYVKDYVNRNTKKIEDELLAEWERRHGTADSFDYTKEGIEAYKKWREAREKEIEFNRGLAKKIAEKRAKEAYSKSYSESEDKIQARKLRTQEINDAKASNEAAKAEAARKERNKKLAERDKDLERHRSKAKKARNQVVKSEMLSYQAQLDREKYAPIHEKARKFVDGTVEVAMDNAKNTLSKLKPNKPAQSAEDKKKKVNRGKAWVFKNLGIELF